MRAGRVAIVALVWALCVPTGLLRAQLPTIPREVREAAKPTTLEGEWMLFEGGATHSFDTISEDDASWQTQLRWRTKEGKMLTITRIQSSCGCLVAKWDKRLGVNASEGVIDVTYYPKGHAGKVNQRLFVYTSLSDEKPTAIITIVGRVAPSLDRSGDYPHTIGALGLRQSSVVMPEKGGEARIAVMNCGTTPLRITHDKRLSTPNLTAHTEPEVLEGGAEGDLVINYDPSVSEGLMLHLGGVNIPPRERKIDVTIEK